MSNPFFDHPILNSPYECPRRHWELASDGQPTQRLVENRRRAEFITPIPKPKKRKGSANQDEMVFDEGKGLSTATRQYDPIKQLISEDTARKTQPKRASASYHNFMPAKKMTTAPKSVETL